MSTAARLAALCSATLLATAGCGGGDGTGPDPEPQAPARGSINGSITNGGSGVAGVAVTLGGGASRTGTSSAAGTFAFADLLPGGYAVSIAVPAGLTLAAGEQASRSVTVTSGQATSLTFQLATAAPTEGTVSGSVRAAGTGLAGASLTLTGGTVSRSATTASGGGYAFAAVPAGGYVVTLAVPTGYALASGEAATRSVTVAAGGTATADFNLVAQGGAVTVIDVQGSAFAPSDISVPRGTRIRWTNNSGIIHTVTPDGHARWTSVELSHGQVFEHVFDTAGTFNYYCEPHRSAGMTGVIRVQ